jgi:hypothetical protein
MPCSCRGENDCLHPEACEYFKGLPKKSSQPPPLRQQEKDGQITQQQQQQKGPPPLRPDFGDSGFDANEWDSNEQ